LATIEKGVTKIPVKKEVEKVVTSEPRKHYKDSAAFPKGVAEIKKAKKLAGRHQTNRSSQTRSG